MTATHPTDRELSHFLLGKLPDPDQAAIESHFAECDQCRDRALTAPPDDTLTELLAAARTRFDSERSSAPTPTLDGSATPPAFAPTLAWDGSAHSNGDAQAPPALAMHPKYRVLRRLGTGGMGTVWMAEHLVMNRPVAIKVIRPDLLARPGATDRFLREVRAAAKLHHPNIVTAFDAEPAGDSCLLVMEYVPGQTLGERLEAGPLPVAEACRAVRDAARGLAHAHLHGLVHRDVKPHNLIRSADGTTKVLDFGLAGVGAGEAIAASGDGLTGAGMVVGTPDYIAPEQIADPHSADARADIYGLGCTLYHLLAGRPPLPDGSVAEKLAAQPTYQPDPIPGLASDVAAVLARMLAKRPEERYQSAHEVVDALDRIINDVRPATQSKWSCTGKPWPLSWTLFVAALVLVAGVVFKIYRDNQEITITTDDPDIEVVMKRKGEVVRVIDNKSGQTWEMNVLTNEIGLADTPDGLKLKLSENETVFLRRHDKEVFRITRVTRPTAAPADDRQAKIDAATKATEAWLKLLDAGDRGRAWDEGAAQLHRAIPRDDLIRMYQDLAQKVGKLQARSFVRRQYPANLRGSPESECVGIEYQAKYELDKAVSELIFVVLEPDGRWRVASYSFMSRNAPLADPKAKPLGSGDNPFLGTGPTGPPKLAQTIEDGHRFPQTIAYTPDGKAMLAAGRDYFAIYNPATGKAVFIDTFGFAGPVTPVAVSADGRTAAVSSGDVFVYDLVAHKRVATISRQEETDKRIFVTSLALAPDGKTVAYVAGREIVYYDRATGQPEHTRPDDDTVRVQTLRYTADGRYLAVASSVEPDQTTRVSVLDTKTHEVVGRCDLPGVLRPVHLAADGERLFVGGTSGGRPVFVVLGLPGCERIERDAVLPPGTGAPIPSADGRLLALTTREGDVQVWDRIQKRFAFAWGPYPVAQPEFSPKGPKAPPHHTSVAVSPDGRTLATARGNEIRLWELTPVAPKTDLDRLEGTWLAVSGEHAGKPWDAAAAKMTRLVFDGEVFRCTFPFPKDLFNPKSGDRPATTTGTFTLDPTRKPGVITLIGEDGDGVLVQGIYRLDGEQLTLCLGKPGHDRPRDFKSQAGGENTLIVLRRLTAEEIILDDVERRIDPAKGDGKNLPFALLERNGVAAIRFGKWQLVFEGVPCDARGRVLFGVGSFFLPETGGRGNFVDPGLKRPAPVLRQQSDSRGNMIGVERYEFEMKAKGARLVFADKTYEATDRVQTIVIARDGTTRLEPAPKK